MHFHQSSTLHVITVDNEEIVFFQIRISPVFEKTFIIDFQEHDTMTTSITDFPGQALKAFVRYLYHQELSSEVHEENTADLWGLAYKYDVGVLKKCLVELRREFVTEASVTNLVLRVDMHGAKEMNDFCLHSMGFTQMPSRSNWRL